jgi:zinc transport system ATP-binding protein
VDQYPKVGCLCDVTQPLVSIRNLRVQFGDTRVLEGVNAAIRRGQITALIGLNGSGKTTLLRTLVKEIPYQGTIQFHCGHDHSQPTPQHVGYVPQKLHIEAQLPLTVCDLLGLALFRRPLFLGVNRKMRKQMQTILEPVGAAHLLDKLVTEISGGERQRVLLSLALQPHPELLLLDEPASGIDFRDVAPFYDLLARLNQESGVTIVMVLHDLTVVPRIAHHVLCLRDGRVQCEGSPQEVIQPEVIEQVFGVNSALYAHHH